MPTLALILKRRIQMFGIFKKKKSQQGNNGTLKFDYEGLDGNIYTEYLIEIEVPEIILHSTPDKNVENIKRNGLRIKMPKTKSLVDINAIFCTIPSENPNTKDLFRYYDDWSVIVIDTKQIPIHKWYIDFLAEEDSSNNGSNKHIMTFENIPANAIKKIIK